MSEINKRIEALEAELQKLKQEVKPTFEVGKWYKSNIGGLWLVTEFKNELTQLSYGFNYKRDWVHEGIRYSSGLTLATDKEVEEALIAYAKTKGFEEDKELTVEFKGYLGYEHKQSFKGKFKWHTESNELGLGHHVIFRDGKWAEIVEDKIEIGGYEVMLSMNGKDTTIDGHTFTKEFWESAKVISEHSKAKIMVGCSKQFDVSLETINQILNKL